MKKLRFCLPVLLSAALLLVSCGESAAPPVSAPDSSLPSSEPSSSEPDAAGPISQAGLDELNRVWNELFQAAGTVYEDVFSNGFSYYTCTSYEVYWAAFMQQCILMREKANGEWRLVDLGGFSAADVDWISAYDDPPVLFLRLTGETHGPDFAFYDFPRNLEYDVKTGELAVTEYFNDWTGRRGGTSWLKQKFSSAEIGTDSVELRFEVLPGQDDPNGHRAPPIDIERGIGFEVPATDYILRFERVEQNLTDGQLAAIAALRGIAEFRADGYDNSGFSGTAWSIRLQEGYELRYFFGNDGAASEYSSFRVQVVPSGS